MRTVPLFLFLSSVVLATPELTDLKFEVRDATDSHTAVEWPYETSHHVLVATRNGRPIGAALFQPSIRNRAFVLVDLKVSEGYSFEDVGGQLLAELAEGAAQYRIPLEAKPVAGHEDFFEGFGFEPKDEQGWHTYEGQKKPLTLQELKQANAFDRLGANPKSSSLTLKIKIKAKAERTKNPQAFQLMLEAYQTLEDPKKRAVLDESVLKAQAKRILKDTERNPSPGKLPPVPDFQKREQEYAKHPKNNRSPYELLDFPINSQNKEHLGRNRKEALKQAKTEQQKAEIENAYHILSDNELRKAWDFLADHPNERTGQFAGDPKAEGFLERLGVTPTAKPNGVAAAYALALYDPRFSAEDRARIKVAYDALNSESGFARQVRETFSMQIKPIRGESLKDYVARILKNYPDLHTADPAPALFELFAEYAADLYARGLRAATKVEDLDRSEADLAIDALKKSVPVWAAIEEEMPVATSRLLRHAGEGGPNQQKNREILIKLIEHWGAGLPAQEVRELYAILGPQKGKFFGAVDRLATRLPPTTRAYDHDALCRMVLETDAKLLPNIESFAIREGETSIAYADRVRKLGAFTEAVHPALKEAVYRQLAHQLGTELERAPTSKQRDAVLSKMGALLNIEQVRNALRNYQLLCNFEWLVSPGDEHGH